eukprot:464254-Pleurochrysis_carterae.AAC.1
MVRSSMPTLERRSDDQLLSSLMLVRPDSSSSSAIADGSGVNLLMKNRRVSDMPPYKVKQLLGAQVVGAFALD